MLPTVYHPSCKSGRQLVMNLHQATQLGAIKIAYLLRLRYYVSNLESLVKDTTFRCTTCAQVNPNMGRKIPQGIWTGGNGPGDGEFGFTEISPTVWSYKYFLVFVDIFQDG